MAVAMAVSSERPSDLPQVACDPGRTFNAGSEGGPAGTRAQILPQGMNVTHTHTHTHARTLRTAFLATLLIPNEPQNSKEMEK